ncbi:MAG: hypothetical protein WBA91_11235 [Paracoccaceae bacterium]
MAYLDLVSGSDSAKEQSSAFQRWITALFAPRVPTPPARKLAGPLPGDLRAQGYLADLDIEVGF